ncbi:ribonuclease H-like domain-containing protein [Tanacetum coccineum]
MRAKFNDFVVNSSVRYCHEKYVCYANLSSINQCFSTTLNKSTEPKTFHEASQNPKWVEAMNLKWKLYIGIILMFLLIFLIGEKLLDVNEFGKLNIKAIYMELPHGYYDKNETKVCKLVKSLYGLKQAPRQWNEKLTTALIEMDLFKHMHAPLQSHFTAALRVLRCLKNAPGTSVQFCKGNNLSLRAFSYADWANVPRLENLCLASTTYEIIWVIKVSKDLGVDGLLPAHLYCDSSSAISIAGNPIFDEKTKHFEIDLHLVREKVSDGVVKVLKVASASNVADIFTKGLGVIPALIANSLVFYFMLVFIWEIYSLYSKKGEEEQALSLEHSEHGVGNGSHVYGI